MEIQELERRIDELMRQNSALAAEVERLSAPQEPVAYQYKNTERAGGKWVQSSEEMFKRVSEDPNSAEGYEVRALYLESQRAAKVNIPNFIEDEEIVDGFDGEEVGYAYGWNDCINEVINLNDNADSSLSAMAEALELALEYRKEQNRPYKSRSPEWVNKAESALATYRNQGDGQ